MGANNPYETQAYKDSILSMGKTFDTERDKSIATARNIFDSKIGEVTNQSARAGSIAGVGNTQRLAAETYAKITGDRDTNISHITTGFNQQKAQQLNAAENRRRESSVEWQQNQAGFMDYLTGAVGLASSAVPFLQGVGILKSPLDGLFGGKNKTSGARSSGGTGSWFGGNAAPEGFMW